MDTGKKALVTGGSSGIGRGIAIVLAGHAYDVAITYGSNAEGAEETVREVEALGRRCYAYQASMELPDPPVQCVKSAITDLGGLTLLVNNAGRTIHHSVLTLTAEDMEYIYGLNYRAYVLASGEAARHMVREGVRGSIIFISSTHSVRAYAYDVLYGSLKAALNRAAESMALDLAPYGIRVNCIAPGATRVRERQSVAGHPFADAIPLQRMGTPRENGELVAFLASDKCTYITGETIKVDGGLVLPGMIESSPNMSLVHPQTDPAWHEKVRRELAAREEKESKGGV